MFRQALGELQRRGAAGEIFQQILELCLKDRIGLGLFVGALQFEQRNHERFRDVAAAIGAEAPGNGGGDGELRNHGINSVTWSATGAQHTAPYEERSAVGAGDFGEEGAELAVDL